jgi:nicotinate-nucleotide adenylyltransferase
MVAKKRIGLYGGTFDPVHLGHLEVAQRVSELFELETVFFVPAQVAPHKLTRPVTAPLHRYAMLALATQSHPRLLVSTFELDAPNRRYTVDTVTQLQATFGTSVELFFIMGADSWSEIDTWRDWERLLILTNHIVVTRPGYDVAVAHVSEELRNGILDLRGNREVPSAIREAAGKNIFFTDVVLQDVSATEIRRAAGAGRFDELKTLVSEPVAEYIKKYELYRDLHEA